MAYDRNNPYAGMPANLVPRPSANQVATYKPRTAADYDPYGAIRETNRVAKAAGVPYTAARLAMGRMSSGVPFGQQPQQPGLQNRNTGRTGSRGGGGGGGGAAAPEVNGQSILDMFAALSNSSALNPQLDQGALDRINAASEADRGVVNQGWNAYDQWNAANQRNPYQEAPRATATQINPDLLNFLASQGVNPAGYQAQVDLSNTAGRQGAENYNRFLDANALNYGTELTGRGGLSQMGRNAGLQNVAAADNAMRMGVEMDFQKQKQAATQQKMELMLKLVDILGPLGMAMPTPAQFGL